MSTPKIVIAMIFSVLLIGCNGAPAKSESEPNNAAPTLTPTPEKATAWRVREAEINPIDGVKSQTLDTGITGSRLVICTKNGKLCSNGDVGVFVTSPCWIDGDYGTGYKRRVRLKFDSDKFRVETWSIGDDHRGIFPRSQKAFIAELKKHKSLMLEFGCDRSDSNVVTYDVHGLQIALDSAGLSL